MIMQSIHPSMVPLSLSILEFFFLSIATTDAQYVTLHWRSWMWYSSRLPVDPLEDDCCDPEKIHIFQTPGGALEQCNKHTQVVFIDCFLFLIRLFGSGGLLLVVSHLFAVRVSVLCAKLEKKVSKYNLDLRFFCRVTY